MRTHVHTFSELTPDDMPGIESTMHLQQVPRARAADSAVGNLIESMPSPWREIVTDRIVNRMSYMEIHRKYNAATSKSLHRPRK